MNQKRTHKGNFKSILYWMLMTIHQNSQDSANIMLGRKFLTLDAYIRKEKRSKNTDAKVLIQEVGKRAK